MNRATTKLSALLTMLCVAATVAGQNYLYSPPFLAKSEGLERTLLFGYSPTMRYQMVDGELRGNSVSLKEVALRRDETYGMLRSRAIGRSWSSVVLRLADGDRAGFGRDFDKNVSSTPTVVFRGSVAWPTIDFPKLVRPAPWGGATGAYRFPFTRPWVYRGKTDVVTDWTHSGGKLANGWYWTTYKLELYLFDGFGAPDGFALSDARRIPVPRLNNDSPGVTSRCNDSTWGIHNGGSYLYGDGQVFGPAPSDPTLKDKLRVRSRTWLTARSAPVLHGWGFASDERGLDVGTGCNRLHIRGAMNVFAVVASSLGVSETPWVAVPWQSSYANGILTLQAAWSDSKTGRIALTQAIELTLPGHAPPTRRALRTSLIQDDRGNVKGPYTGGNHNPVLRYTH